MGVIEAITWESLLRGGVEIGEQVELSSPSMGEGWNIIVKRFPTDSVRVTVRHGHPHGRASLHEDGKSG